jgi:L-iditol 2-dehydrogenase
MKHEIIGQRAETMNACVLRAVGDFSNETVAVPGIRDDEVLLRIRAAGICGSDIPRVYTKGTYHFPTIPGHEFSGECVAVNKGDESLLGKRFAVYPLIPCGKCAFCGAEAYQQCVDYDYYGSRRDGGFAEYLSVKKWNLVPIPDSVSFEAAAMLEPCAVAIHAVNRAGVRPGDRVAVFGAGTIGLLLAQLAVGYGARTVVLFDVDDRKLDFARSIGFGNCENSLRGDPAERFGSVSGGPGADLAIDAAGVSSSVEAALAVAETGGEVVLMGNPAGDIHLAQKKYWEILRKQLTLRGTWNSAFGTKENDWKTAIKAMEDGILNVEPLITGRYGIAQCREAFGLTADPGAFSVKTMFVF